LERAWAKLSILFWGSREDEGGGGTVYIFLKEMKKFKVVLQFFVEDRKSYTLIMNISP
jgi:hypothetical protein